MSKWYKLSEKKPVGQGPFLTFPNYIVCGHSINISNGDYLRGPYVDKEIMWSEIELPEGFEEFEQNRWRWEDE